MFLVRLSGTYLGLEKQKAASTLCRCGLFSFNQAWGRGLFPAYRVKDLLRCGDVLRHVGQVHLIRFEFTQLCD